MNYGYAPGPAPAAPADAPLEVGAGEPRREVNAGSPWPDRFMAFAQQLYVKDPGHTGPLRGCLRLLIAALYCKHVAYHKVND